jgi:transcriptional regulator with XRE-family HTH domain
VNPEQLRAALRDLKWTPALLARECGYSRQGVSRWLDGTSRVPEPIADWIISRLEGYLTDPPSRGRERLPA